jgi:hypothetical protein
MIYAYLFFLFTIITSFFYWFYGPRKSKIIFTNPNAEKNFVDINSKNFNYFECKPNSSTKNCVFYVE